MKYDESLRCLRATLPVVVTATLIIVLCVGAQCQDFLSSDPWVQLAQITASDEMIGDEFGYSVATSGDTVVVGAPMYGAIDAAYVFVKPPGGWANGTQTAKLTLLGGGNNTGFGTAVAISGDTIVVGAYGGAYVFVKPSSGWRDMTETAVLRQPGAYFGLSVAIDGDTVVVGDYGVNDFQGVAYVFIEPPGGWTDTTETAELTASDAAAGAYMGVSVATRGNTIVVGAPEATIGKTKLLGAAYVFVKPSGGWTDMTQTAKLTSGGFREAYAELGLSVAIDGNTVVAGKPSWQKGEACVFVEPASGWSDMTEAARLRFPQGKHSHLGISVAISGKTIVAGAPLGNPHGAGYVFVKPSTGWKTTSKIRARLTAKTGVQHDQLGYSVSVRGKTAVIGGPGTYPYTSPGVAYIFGH